MSVEHVTNQETENTSVLEWMRGNLTFRQQVAAAALIACMGREAGSDADMHTDRVGTGVGMTEEVAGAGGYEAAGGGYELTIEQGSNLTAAIATFLQARGIDDRDAVLSALNMANQYAMEQGLADGPPSLVYPGDTVRVEMKDGMWQMTAFSSSNADNLQAGYLAEPAEEPAVAMEPELQQRVAEASSEVAVEQAVSAEVMVAAEVAEREAMVQTELATLKESMAEYVGELGVFSKLSLVQEIKDRADELRALADGTASSGEFSDLLTGLMQLCQETVERVRAIDAAEVETVRAYVIESISFIESAGFNEIKQRFS
jgi:hypothetical protein